MVLDLDPLALWHLGCALSFRWSHLDLSDL